MPQAYSDDLRIKLLDAYEAGEGSLAKLAVRFRVSVGYAEKIHAHLARTGSKLRAPQLRHGPVSRIDETAREKLLALVNEQPDRTLAELQQGLGQAGVRVCRSRVCQVLQAMGLRRKKNAARQ